MLEGKVAKVSPEFEQFTIDANQKFGWEVVGAQEVFSQVSRQEARSDGVYSVVQSTNFVRLLFKRDTKMPHYKEIKALEEEFDSIPYPKKKKLSAGWAFLNVMLFLSAVIFIAVGIVVGNQRNTGDVGTPLLIIGVCSAVLWIISLAICSHKKKKNQELFDYQVKVVMEKKQEILKKVEAYID